MSSILIKGADGIDRWVGKIGEWCSWTAILLFSLIILQVVLRYVFRSGMIVLEELQWHLYGIIIMIGVSYGQVKDAHVRVDLFHHRFPPKVKAFVEIIGILFLFVPFIAIVFFHSIDFFVDSWSHNERSAAPDGLPARWFIKGVIPFGLGLWFLSAISRVIRDIHKLLEPNGN